MEYREYTPLIWQLIAVVLSPPSLDAGCSRAVSIASQPMGPRSCSSTELHTFIQEQRKIIASFRTQPWPMQMKLAALRYHNSEEITLSYCSTIMTGHVPVIELGLELTTTYYGGISAGATSEMFPSTCLT